MRELTKTTVTAFVIVLALFLSACGTTTTDRAASGALIGSGVGAAIGSLYGDAGRGAVLGGVAGAAAGALTDPCSVNLGHPVWRDANANQEDYYRRCGHNPPAPPPPDVSWGYYGETSQAYSAPPYIPPGHLPEPGQCRIWYPDQPPGQQPPPGPCYELRNRVPYGAYLVSG